VVLEIMAHFPKSVTRESDGKLWQQVFFPFLKEIPFSIKRLFALKRE